jgi:hypothetical protein
VPKKVIPISKGSIGLKCGDCLHFKRNAKFEKPCHQLGVKHFQDAPYCYTPDAYLLTKKNPEVLYQLGMLLKDFSAQESRVFMSILKASKAFEKHYDLKFGQPVYFKVGNDFLSNYFRGFVIGVAEAGDNQVFITSDLGKKQRVNPMVGSFLRDSVLTSAEWKAKRSALQKAKRLVDPAATFTAPPKVKLLADDYVPPSMETAPTEWFDKATDRVSSKKLKKSKDGTLEFKIS